MDVLDRVFGKQIFPTNSPSFRDLPTYLGMEILHPMLGNMIESLQRTSMEVIRVESRIFPVHLDRNDDLFPLELGGIFQLSVVLSFAEAPR